MCKNQPINQLPAKPQTACCQSGLLKQSGCFTCQLLNHRLDIISCANGFGKLTAYIKRFWRANSCKAFILIAKRLIKPKKHILTKTRGQWRTRQSNNIPNRPQACAPHMIGNCRINSQCGKRQCCQMASQAGAAENISYRVRLSICQFWRGH